MKVIKLTDDCDGPDIFVLTHHIVYFRQIIRRSGSRVFLGGDGNIELVVRESPEQIKEMIENN